MAGPKMRLKQNGATIVEFTIDGVTHSQQINNIYFDRGVIMPQIYKIVQKLLYKIGNTKKRIKNEMDTSDRENRKDELNFVINSEIHAAWNYRIERLSYLLNLIESGEYRTSCVLYRCPDHKIRGGTCDICDDLSEILAEIPESVGCRNGRERIGTEKIYGSAEKKLIFGNVMRVRRHH